jgi:hypothetical protein
MTVSTLTWRPSALYTLTASTHAAAIAGLKAAVDAEVAANPTTALWQVADYSSGTLTLKRTANGSGGSGRIMIFGGSSPNTLAIDGATAGSASLYGGYAPNATADAPEASYASGVPYTTGDWIPGGLITTLLTSIDRVTYFESTAGMFIVWRRAAMNATSTNLATFFAGQLAVSLDGSTAYHIAGGSAGLWAGSQDSVTAAGASLWIGHGGEGTASSARTNFKESAGNVKRCQKLQALGIASNTDRLKDAGAKRYFLPILMPNSDSSYIAIKLRQIAGGIEGIFGQAISDASGVAAYKIAGRSDSNDHGPWLTNFLI